MPEYTTDDPIEDASRQHHLLSQAGDISSAEEFMQGAPINSTIPDDGDESDAKWAVKMSQDSLTAKGDGSLPVRAYLASP